MAKTDHKGHEIAFDEASEEWTCGSLALSDPSLKRLKASIDKASKQRRRVNVEAYQLTDYWRQGVKLKKCTIVLLREGDRKADIKIERESGQSQADLCELYALDQKPALDAYIQARKAAVAAEEKAARLHENLEQLTAKAVREAVVRQAEQETT